MPLPDAKKSATADSQYKDYDALVDARICERVMEK